MLLIRSALFNVLFLLWTIGLGLAIVVPGLAGPRRWTQRCARLWGCGVFLLLRRVVGLSHEVHGLENIPAGTVIIAAKHQSAWDTLLFHTLLEDPVFVVKKELFLIPVIGWLMRKSGCIGIDRSNGMQALKKMIQGVKDAADNGSQLVIFPEGTRTAPGVSSVYQPGIALLYKRAPLIIVPVALNSGLFWGRRRFVKRPGHILVEFLPPLPVGLERHAFLAALQCRIDSTTRRLEQNSLMPCVQARTDQS
ncbi:1-acyl-sn-glycerol-3-phosphate acyltransferase [invertebrate metagenome]|uniref:1-acyl-sn-glycerol-3-phosphate acyltransferase n=1 Tax=invertebrate metagenome TaxID=1711999 RepID=A0A484H7Y3_9ZZZZ